MQIECLQKRIRSLAKIYLATDENTQPNTPTNTDSGTVIFAADKTQAIELLKSAKSKHLQLWRFDLVSSDTTWLLVEECGDYQDVWWDGLQRLVTANSGLSDYDNLNLISHKLQYLKTLCADDAWSKKERTLKGHYRMNDLGALNCLYLLKLATSHDTHDNEVLTDILSSAKKVNEFSLIQPLFRVRHRTEECWCYFTAVRPANSECLASYIKSKSDKMTTVGTWESVFSALGHNKQASALLRESLQEFELEVLSLSGSWTSYKNANTDHASTKRLESMVTTSYGLKELGPGYLSYTSAIYKSPLLIAGADNWMQWCDANRPEFVTTAATAPRRPKSRPSFKVTTGKVKRHMSDQRRQELDAILEIAKTQFENVIGLTLKRLGIKMSVKYSSIFDTQNNYKEYNLSEVNGTLYVTINVGCNINKVDIVENQQRPTIQYVNPKHGINSDLYLEQYTALKAKEFISRWFSEQRVAFSSTLEKAGIDSGVIKDSRKLELELYSIIGE